MVKREAIDTKKEIKDPDPIIEFTQKAWRKINYVIQTCSQEVGWLGSVEKVKGTTNPYHLRITDIWVPKQEVHATTCEIKTDGRDALLQELFEKAETPQKGMELANSIRYWGHSHVNMGVGASGQDDQEILGLKDCPWYIRGIHNKKGEINLALYVFSENVVYRDLKPVVLDAMPEDEKADLDCQIKNNVKQKSYTYSTPSYNYYGGNYCKYDTQGFDSTIHFFEDQERHGGHHIMWAPGPNNKTVVRKRFKNAESYDDYKKKTKTTVPTKSKSYDLYDDPYYDGWDDTFYSGNSWLNKKKTKKMSDERIVVKTKKLDPLTGDIIDEIPVIENTPKQQEFDIQVETPAFDVQQEPSIERQTSVWNKQKQCWEIRTLKG